MDNKFVMEILIEMQKEIDKLTTGNISHKKPGLQMAVRELVKIIEND